MSGTCSKNSSKILVNIKMNEESIEDPPKSTQLMPEGRGIKPGLLDSLTEVGTRSWSGLRKKTF